VYKALNVLDYCVKNGTKRFVEESRDCIHKIEDLKSFQVYIYVCMYRYIEIYVSRRVEIASIRLKNSRLFRFIYKVHTHTHTHTCIYMEESRDCIHKIEDLKSFQV
jgi:hypothetical protein